jgi:uncharacterized membrane protein
MAKSKNRPLQEADAETTEEKALNTLLDLIDQDVEALASIRGRAEQEVSHHQRRIERVTANLGRPRFLYFILSFVLFWVAANVFLVNLHATAFDPPPFYWLEGIIGLSALLMTTVVLITQNRQGKIDDQRRHLDLTITLLTERKVSKLIELVEELRHDMPMVKDRYDPQAEVMKEMADPAEVLTSFNRAMDEVAPEANL